MDFIIPFRYKGDRYPLFQKCIKNIRNLFKKNKIIIHELDTTQKLSTEFIKKYDLNHIFSFNNDVFHRAFAINEAAKHSNSNLLCFMDSDILITNKWKELIKSVDLKTYYIAWETIIMLNEKETNNLINDKPYSIEGKIKKPHFNLGSAGGVNIIGKELFDYVKGIPEDFKGTWGGEDNAMCIKLQKLGINIKMIPTTLIHLHHNDKTYVDFRKKQQILKNIQLRTKEDWLI